jgi:galactokinase
MSVQENFYSIFGYAPTLVVNAPGRINLIGEHTDYNGSFVLPAAIDKGITFALSLRDDDNCLAIANDFGEQVLFSIQPLTKQDAAWTHYLKGVIEQFQLLGHPVKGFNVVLGGDIPTGAGLSSSAAVEAGLAFALNTLFDFKVPKMELVRLCQRAENQFVGLQCGIMDMFVSMMGKADSVIRLDCRSLEYQYFPFLQNEYAIVLCNTGVKHSLADSEYNTRRQECERGVAILKKYYPDLQFLREVTPEMLHAHQAEFDPITYQRCDYVVQETVRVVAACKDLERNDLRAFGKKMYATHRGLSQDYAVSCKELDFLVEQTFENDTVLGARMMGGGFGGCTINLVHQSSVQDFIQRQSIAYQNAFGIALVCYEVAISEGVRSVEG